MCSPVTNEDIAIQIAEAAWIPIYGSKMVQAERPIRAQLNNGVWRVFGSLHGARGAVMIGGVMEARVAQADGRILEICHGK
jgi:hypothetical protein